MPHSQLPWREDRVVRAVKAHAQLLAAAELSLDVLRSIQAGHESHHGVDKSINCLQAAIAAAKEPTP